MNDGRLQDGLGQASRRLDAGPAGVAAIAAKQQGHLLMAPSCETTFRLFGGLPPSGRRVIHC
jgi:hypothetical protein